MGTVNWVKCFTLWRGKTGHFSMPGEHTWHSPDLWKCSLQGMRALVFLNFPNQESNLCPLHWKGGVLTTGPPGKSLDLPILMTPCPITNSIR